MQTMQYPFPEFAPYSTGSLPRFCVVCGQQFIGLGVRCPVHLAQYARQRAAEVEAARVRSERILAARVAAARKPRTEWYDEIDLMDQTAAGEGKDVSTAETANGDARIA